MTRHHPTIQELLAEPPPVVPDDGGSAFRPVIALSRQEGARGEEVAEALAGRLRLQVYDREILHGIAQNVRCQDAVIAALDERKRTLLADFFSSLTPDEHVSPYAYFVNLTLVVSSIARAGGAVILGRGAHLILSRGQALRIRVVAPLDDRVRAVASAQGMDRAQAAQKITATEKERRDYLRQYFGNRSDDETAFDLVVNTSVLGVEGAVAAVAGALETAGPKRPSRERTAWSAMTVGV